MAKGHKIIYTPEMQQFIVDNQYGITRRELTDRFNNHFDVNFEADNIKAYCLRHGLSNGNDGKFKKGQISPTKGVPMTPEKYKRCQATMFKKGNIPKNHRPVGSERVSVDGYIEIKVAEPNKWKLKHRYIWEKVNGPIPEGNTLIFVDQNKMNVTLENLRLIKRAHLCAINRWGSDLTDDSEINSAIIDVAEFTVALSNAKKERKKVNETKKQRRTQSVSK